MKDISIIRDQINEFLKPRMMLSTPRMMPISIATYGDKEYLYSSLLNSLFHGWDKFNDVEREHIAKLLFSSDTIELQNIK